MLPGSPSRSTSKDMLVAGLGLGGIVYAILQLARGAGREGMPLTPTTNLNEAAPLLGPIAEIPTNPLIAVSLAAIPILVVAGLTAHWWLRAVYAAVLVALLGTVAWSFGPAGNVDPMALILVVASVAVVSAAILFWGTLSAWSWIVAALTFQALGGLRKAVYGPIWEERGAGAMAMLVACALITLVVGMAARVPKDAPIPDESLV